MAKRTFTVINEFKNIKSIYKLSLQFEIEYDLKKYINKHWWKLKFLPEPLFISKLNNLLRNFETYLGHLCGVCYHIRYSLSTFVHYDNTIDYIIYITGLWNDYKLME